MRKTAKAYLIAVKLGKKVVVFSFSTRKERGKFTDDLLELTNGKIKFAFSEIKKFY